MKIYIHNGAGHYVGSHVVVLAHNEEHATMIIRNQLDEAGLQNEEIESLQVVELDQPALVLFDSGDY